MQHPASCRRQTDVAASLCHVDQAHTTIRQQFLLVVVVVLLLDTFDDDEEDEDD